MVLVTTLYVLPLAAETGGPQANLKELVKRLASDYPNIVHRSLAELVEQSENVVLVDVRDAEEYEVSHIPGALHIQDLSILQTFIEGQSNEVVLYCSVGYRSAELVRQLQAQGVDGVSNFAGSIFDWANHGHPLTNGSQPADTVHPYNWFWGWRYLEKDLRAD